MHHYPQALVSLDALKDDPENPQMHSDAEIQRLVGAIGAVGFIQPIAVDTNTMMILAGHGRAEAARLAGMTEVPALLVDDYDATKRRLALIGTNGNYGHFDDDALTGLLRELEADSVDLDLSGIEPFRLDELLSPEAAAGLTDPDDVPETPAVPITKRGDVILLGRHRLMCGDATSREDVERLMDGKQADMVWTDPPYGIEIVSTTGYVGGGEAYSIPFGGVKHEGKSERAKRLGTANGSKPFGSQSKVVGTDGADNMIPAGRYAPIIGDDSTQTAVAAYALCASLGIPVLIFWGGNYYASALPDSSCWIVWDKENTGNFADAELAWTNQKSAVRIFRHMWNGLMKASERGDKRLSPAQKPIALAEWCFEQYGKSGDTVLDLFAGSGVVLIAAEKTNRTALLMEMSEPMCDVIVARYEAFTGQRVERPAAVPV